MYRIVKVAQPNIKNLDLDWSFPRINKSSDVQILSWKLHDKEKKKKKPQRRKAYLNSESPIAQDTNKNYLT